MNAHPPPSPTHVGGVADGWQHRPLMSPIGTPLVMGAIMRRVQRGVGILGPCGIHPPPLPRMALDSVDMSGLDLLSRGTRELAFRIRGSCFVVWA